MKWEDPKEWLPETAIGVLALHVDLINDETGTSYQIIEAFVGEDGKWFTNFFSDIAQELENVLAWTLLPDFPDKIIEEYRRCELKIDSEGNKL